MHEVEVAAVSIDPLTQLVNPQRGRALDQALQRTRDALGAHTVWNVNATATGGGVAEMLPTLLGYARSAGIDSRWLVLDGDAEFFAITKRLHNRLHSNPADDGPLGPAERDWYLSVLDDNLNEMLPLMQPGDTVMLHDPQTAGLIEGLQRAGLSVAWRSHIGSDGSNEHTAEAWAFLQPFVELAHAVIFTRSQYAPDWIDRERLFVIPPTIDPLSAKNRELTPAQVRALVQEIDAVAYADGPPPPPDARLVVQVSRWDRLKDMAGVLTAFAMLTDPRFADTHLVLAGPEVSGVSDDPEGAEVLSECREMWQALTRTARDRVHLATLPMDDIERNAMLVNALQRRADVIVQKSLAEGFGLTITEAMWKGRPVIASRVGGVRDQITHDVDGLLLDDPGDLATFAAAIARLLDRPRLADRLGRAAHARILESFLDDRQLWQLAELHEYLAGDRARPIIASDDR